jgi:hypothetical protein
LAASDFWQSGPIKTSLAGLVFNDADEVFDPAVEFLNEIRVCEWQVVSATGSNEQNGSESKLEITITSKQNILNSSGKILSGGTMEGSAEARDPLLRYRRFF